MTVLERREDALQRMTLFATGKGQLTTRDTNDSAPMCATGSAAGVTIDFHHSEPLPATPPERHHHISSSRNFPTNLAAWLAINHGSITTKVH